MGQKFRAYTLKPGSGQVTGILWALNEKQFEALKNWEFDKLWREIIEVEVVTTDLRKLKAYTEKALTNPEVIQIVDGLNYESNLNKEGMKPEAQKDDEYRIKELQLVREELASMSTRA